MYTNNTKVDKGDWYVTYYKKRAYLLQVFQCHPFLPSFSNASYNANELAFRL